MMARSAVLAASERTERSGRRASLRAGPAIAEPWVVVDPIEVGVAIAELFANPFDKGPNIGAVSFRTVPGDKILAVHEIVDFSVADVLPGALGKQCQDLELGQGEIDRPSGP